MFVGLSGGDNSDYRIAISVTVAYNEDAKCEAHAQHQEPFLIPGMVGVEESDGVLVEEHRLSFLERDLVFSLVLPALAFVPLESNAIHKYIVHMATPERKSFLLLNVPAVRRRQASEPAKCSASFLSMIP
jgi:hypothetical protein